jgi:hypothetical protein
MRRTESAANFASSMQIILRSRRPPSFWHCFGPLKMPKQRSASCKRLFTHCDRRILGWGWTLPHEHCLLPCPSALSKRFSLAGLDPECRNYRSGPQPGSGRKRPPSDPGRRLAKQSRVLLGAVITRVEACLRAFVHEAASGAGLRSAVRRQATGCHYHAHALVSADFSSAKLKLGVLVRFLNEGGSLARADRSRRLVLLPKAGFA